MTTKTTDVAIATSEQNGVAVAEQKNEAMPMQTVDLNTGIFPSLDDAQAFPIDLMADYWTPEEKNEEKRLYFDKIAIRKVADQQTGDIIDLECAFFFEVIGGEAKSISNGSKRLVGVIQANNIQRGTPLLIKYMGKKKNKNNGFLSDNWSVKPLQIKI
jgi:hypothetical protein